MVVIVVAWLTVALCLVISPPELYAQPPSAAPPVQLPAVEVREQHLDTQHHIRETSTFATAVDTSDATARVERRVFTSTKARTGPRRATRSSSTPSARTLRARMR